MIDWARLYELRSDIGAEHFADVVTMFLDEAAAAIEGLSTAPSQAPQLLHNLKGCALNLGLVQLASLCRDSERRIAIGATPDIAATAQAYVLAREGLLNGLRDASAA